MLLGDLLLPSLLLAAVLVATPVVLLLDTRGKRLEQRIDLVVSRSVSDADQPSLPNIRLAQSRTGTMHDLAYMLLRVPIDMPLAHLLPAWLIIAVAIAEGVMSGLFTRHFLSLTPSLAVGVVSGYLMARGFFNWELKRYQNKLLSQFPDTLELVTSTARAGLPLMEAFRAVMREMPDPTREEFSRACNDVALGKPPDEALMGIHRRTRLTEYAIFGVTVAVQTRSGGRIAESLQNLADTVRQRATVMGKAKALSSEARLTARIISVMPFISGAAMSAINPGYLTPLFTDSRGKTMFVIGVCTLLAGSLSMRWLVNSVTKE